MLDIELQCQTRKVCDDEWLQILEIIQCPAFSINVQNEKNEIHTFL